VGRKPFKTPDEKLAIVLSVLKGETTQVEIARRFSMSQTTIANGRSSSSRAAASRSPAVTTRRPWPAGGRSSWRPRSRS
jgi:transposase-like protein